MEQNSISDLAGRGMNRNLDNDPEDGGSRRGKATLSGGETAIWFLREVLPLEPLLMQFLHRNWRNQDDIADLRQDVYVKVWVAAHNQFPDHTKRFVLAIARNLIINKLRDAHVVPIELIADVDALGSAVDAPGVDQTVVARDELRRLQDALDQLPPRCREAVLLAHVEGLAGHEIAQRMGITRAAVSIHLAQGLRTLTNIMYGEEIAREKKS
jgi:RNA polymerase sigma factor (sigma-70 family)